jgi:hypothetical protein
MTKLQWATHQHHITLTGLLQEMDVPAMRCDASSVSNLRWLQRNLAINNSNHPNCKKALKIIKWLLKEGWIDTSHIGA